MAVTMKKSGGRAGKSAPESAPAAKEPPPSVIKGGSRKLFGTDGVRGVANVYPTSGRRPLTTTSLASAEFFLNDSDRHSSE